jgi:serine/threonine-protein kinase
VAGWRGEDQRRDPATTRRAWQPFVRRHRRGRFGGKAFEHAGGEIIFHLPNGLQGYLLVDDKDRRIDKGPTEVVRAKTETAGSVAVVNGLSCMSCHQHGMIKGFKDDVRTGTRVGGDALDKVRELYPPAEEMRGLLEKDEARFLNALDRATGLFLKVGKEGDRDVKDFKEVMGPVARSYLLKEVDAAAAAREVGLKDKATLEAAIKANKGLQRLGLLPLARGGTIKREVWESLKGLYSPAQETARVLELGTPLREK